MQTRTRFAPSPTGKLHIGGARTALFSWLYAKKHHGKFILRIENTDLERSTEESVRAILEGLEWLGIDYDEGPFYQTARMARYKEVLEQLLKEGKAYRCYCSKERLDDLRDKQLQNKEKPRYDGLCRVRDPNDPNQPYVIRFRNPDQGVVSFIDSVHGKITFDNSELDDLIIARSDGTPTYNFAVVVDDYDMHVTHIIRGDDHINNTPRQINLLRALNAEPPHYSHVPMILGADGKRLSKRHGAEDLLQYRENGYLPATIMNYLARLGWSHGDQEIFSVAEMIELFDIDAVNKSPAALNPQKLLWLNQHYMKNSEPQEVVKHLKWQMDQMHIDITQGPDLAKIVRTQAERCHTLREMAEKSKYFYLEFVDYQDSSKKHLSSEIAAILTAVTTELNKLNTWDAASIHQVIVACSEKFAIKFGKIAQPIRVAITGGEISPPLDVTLELIGKDRVIARLEKALDFIGR